MTETTPSNSAHHIVLGQTDYYTVSAVIDLGANDVPSMLILSFRSHIRGKADNVILGPKEMEQLIAEWRKYAPEGAPLEEPAP